MSAKLRRVFILAMYLAVFGIGLYLIFAGKDWRGYIALISTPLLHTLIKTISQNKISK
ncbi:hypothetical protein KA517_00910 [Candidatus Gracilibacteria bacterium]|nr:hypothetical protein [Candidatus Gracilibacteria bacterium]